MQIKKGQSLPHKITLEKYLNTADEMLSQGKLEQAAVAYQQVIQLDPNSAQAHHNLGNIQTLLEEWHKAQQCYSSAIEIDPDNFWLYFNLGHVLRQQQKWTAALAAYKKAVILDSQNAWAVYYLGDVLRHLEQWELAVNSYEQALQLDNDQFSFFYSLGESLLIIDRCEEAANAFSQAINLKPDFEWSFANLSKAFTKLEQLGPAELNAYKKALALTSQYSKQKPFINNEIQLKLEKLKQLPDQNNHLFDGGIAYISGNFIVGWIITSNSHSEFCDVRLRIETEIISSASANLSRKEIPEIPEDRNDRCWFKLQIPDSYLTGQEYVFEVLTPDEKILDQPIQYKFFLKGNLDIIQRHHIAGWVLDPQSNHSVEIDIYIDNNRYISIPANLKRLDVTEAFGCGFDLSTPIANHSFQSVLITLKDSNIPILDTPKFLFSPVGAISTLYKLGNTVRAGSGDFLQIEKNWILNHLFPDLITSFRNSVRDGGESILTFHPNQDIHSKLLSASKSPVVDVIIPIYKNYVITKICIESVLNSKNETPLNLVAINDESPDPEIWLYLEDLANQGKIQLLINHSNKGFVHSVNRGMSLSNDRDVVLLNSDAIVVDYWLDRLRKAAYSSSNIASATPISNHASIFSYPRMAEEVEQMPEEIDAQEIDNICTLVNKDFLVDVPTNHGFCCFLRRETLTQVGLFDEQKWEKGYGEEVDWSQRSLRLGWRHVAVPGIFIHHVGSQSFSENKLQAISNALTKIASEYPEFDAIVHDFIKADPLAKYRRKIDIERLKRTAQYYILFIAHDLGGGTYRHISDMSEQLQTEGYPVVCLAPEKDGWIKLITLGGIDIHSRYWIADPVELQTLLNDLALINVFHIHVHSTIGFGDEEIVWKIISEAKIPYDITVHDYQSICPRVNLAVDGKYCGEPVESACNICILQNGTYNDEGIKNLSAKLKTIAQWRSYYLSKMNLARKIFVPSHDTKARLLKYFPSLEIDVRPHLEKFRDLTLKSLLSADPEVPYRIAIIGAISEIKGHYFLRDCAKYALKYNYPLEFIVFGHTKDDSEFEYLSNVHILGKYANFNELKLAVEANPCNIAAFFSTWPETYSYTLSEALSLGFIPVSLNIGAISERVQEIEGSILIDIDEALDQVINKLIQAAQFSQRHQVSYTFGNSHYYPSLFSDYYEFKKPVSGL